MKKVQAALKEKYPTIHVYKDYFVSRTPVVSLKEKDIKDIIDPVIQKKLREYLAQHSSEKLESVLTAFTQQTKIRKVRCKNFVQKPIEIAPDAKNLAAVTRYLSPEDYFAVIIWMLPPEKEGKLPKYEAQYIRRDELKDKKPIDKKPHPAAKKICQLHKNDYIEFAENGLWKKARIAGYSATTNRLDIRPIYASENIQDWIIATSEYMLEEGWKQRSGQNYISVNVLFGSLSACKITVSPIGRVCRKKRNTVFK